MRGKDVNKCDSGGRKINVTALLFRPSCFKMERRAFLTCQLLQVGWNADCTRTGPCDFQRVRHYSVEEAPGRRVPQNVNSTPDGPDLC